MNYSGTGNRPAEYQHRLLEGFEPLARPMQKIGGVAVGEWHLVCEYSPERQDAPSLGWEPNLRITSDTNEAAH